jgi:trimeric autotransporter adhesin
MRTAIAAALGGLLSIGGIAGELPTGGQVSAGHATITESGNAMTVQQSSGKVAIDWTSFSIGAGDSVTFNQPSSSAIALNEILGQSPSSIFGSLSANGQVFLLNPNGILFGRTAEVSVGGLIASTLDLSTSEFLLGRYAFIGLPTSGSVENLGNLSATSGGYLAFIGPKVTNAGVLNASQGTVGLAAGDEVTLTLSGRSAIGLTVDVGTLNALAENSQLIRADGGQVILTSRGLDTVLSGVVNNSGVIEARTVSNDGGTIHLIASGGTVEVGGTLDASAPQGGNGGFIETDGTRVEVANGAKVTTLAAAGKTGTWLIDPTDFTVAPSGGDLTGATLSSELNSTNTTILSSNGTSPVTGDPTGTGGNININDTVSWSANTTLTLTAANNVNINSNVTATGDTASLIINPNTANGSETTPSGTGTLNIGAGASVTLSGANASLSIASPTYNLVTGATINLPNVSPTSTTALVIGGTSYTVLNNLGAAGSTTGTDLQGMQGNLAGNYALGTNIDATTTSGWNAGAGFTPVGNSATDTSATQFTGTFDGLGHTISNLTINLPTTDFVGLFGVVAQGATVRNVGLVGGSVIGGNYVGGLAGGNDGTVSNSYATGSVSGGNYVGGLLGDTFVEGTVNNSYATGSVSGTQNIGGLVGFLAGAVTNSYASGSVSGNEDVGGLVGAVSGVMASVSNSYATGSVSGNQIVGGLAGENDGTVSNSYATGSVSGSGGGANLVGGLIGENDGTVNGSYATGTVVAVSSGSYDIGGLAGGNDGTVSNSYAMGNVNGGTTGAAVGGLVGYDQFGTVSNSYATGSVSGYEYVGGLVGDSLTVSYAPISNSYATGSVSSGGEFVGGLVGNNDGPISNSYATGSVSVTGSFGAAGGLVGYNSLGSTISDSYATGSVSANDIVGGLVGDNLGTVSKSYATGSVTGGAFVGGLVGENSGTVSDSYWNTTVNGVLAGIGGGTSTGATGLTTAQMQTASNFTGFTFTTTPGASGNNWVIVDTDGSLNNALGAAGATFPMLASEYSTSITNAHQLQLMAMNPAASYTLAQNIDASTTGSGTDVWSSSGFAPIGNSTTPFTGSLNGQGYTINHLTIYLPSNDEVGLFGVTGVGSVIQNVGLLGDSVNGNEYVGGLVGYNAGSVTNSYAGVSFRACGFCFIFSGSVTGNAIVGGLVGYSDGTVSNSYATGSVNASAGSEYVGGLVGYSDGTISNSYAAGSVSGNSDVGGLVGVNEGTVSSSYATGSVTGSDDVGGLAGYNANGATISDSYATGSVTGSDNVGGLVGYNAGTIDCYATGNVSGTNYVGGLVGYNDGGTISNSFASGSVSGSSPVGGLVGANSGTVSNSFWNADANPGLGGIGAGNTSGAIGLSAAQMQSCLSGSCPTPVYVDPTSGSSIYGSTPSITYTLVNASGTLETLTNATVSGTPDYSSLAPTSTSNVGTYDFSYVSGLTLTGSGAGNYVLTPYTTATPWTVSPLALTGTISTGTSVYGSALNPGSATFTNMVASNPVTATVAVNTTGNTSTSGNLKAGTYTGIEYITGLSGADPSDYTFAGVTGNYTVGQLALAVTGLTAINKVYNGSTADPLGGTAAIAPISGDVVSLSGTGMGSFANPNVGTAKPVTVSGYTLTGSDAGNYLLVEPTGLTANITQLASVAWVGGTTGNWSVASNWAGGAIPDYANVAAVTIPSGDTVTYDSGVPGATMLTTLTSSGNLVMAAGNLSTTGNLTTGGYQQTGGILDVGGSLTIHSVSGGVTLGNITAGSLSIDSQGGAITQLASSTLDVIGTSSLAEFPSASSKAPGSYAITLANATNDFGGAVSAIGSNINLLDTSTGGLILGDTIAIGTLTATSRGGAITQAASTAVGVVGATNLTANNGVSGAGAVNYGITLTNALNTFVGAVSSNGSNINLLDGLWGLTLGNTTATGTLTATSRGGAITQVASTAVDVTGASSLTADNGVSGKGAADYAITLSNATNTFGGVVTATGSAITLDDSAALTAVLDSTGASSLTSVGALNVSGAVGTSLTTDTTRANSATTFGATTIGTTLKVTSTGAVTETSPNILTVDGEGTTTVKNKNVTVNGVVGAEIP